MNIFALDKSPIISAQQLCDKHIVKQGLESCQMLCSVFDNAPYKRTHYNHPCTIWVRSSKRNYEWLIDHATEIFNEYTRRYGKIHKSQRVLEWVKDNYSSIQFPSNALTPHIQCMPDQYKHANFVTAYRNFYIYEKTFAKWKLGNVPTWYKKP